VKPTNLCESLGIVAPVRSHIWRLRVRDFRPFTVGLSPIPPVKFSGVFLLIDLPSEILDDFPLWSDSVPVLVRSALPGPTVRLFRSPLSWDLQRLPPPRPNFCSRRFLDVIQFVGYLRTVRTAVPPAPISLSSSTIFRSDFVHLSLSFRNPPLFPCRKNVIMELGTLRLFPLGLSPVFQSPLLLSRGHARTRWIYSAFHTSLGFMCQYPGFLPDTRRQNFLWSCPPCLFRRHPALSLCFSFCGCPFLLPKSLSYFVPLRSSQLRAPTYDFRN